MAFWVTMVRVSFASSRARGVLVCALVAVPLTRCYSTSGSSSGDDDASAGVAGSAGEGTGGSSEGGAPGSGASGGSSGGSSGATAVGGGGSSAGADAPGSSGEGPIAGNASGGDAGGGVVVPPNCGNGTVDDGEECDDGDLDDGDGCSSSCTNEGCPVGETSCLPVCGDGRLGTGERCDDGNTADGDGCSALCDGITDGYSCPVPGELCTQGPACGNGAVEGTEACDDGDRAAEDGCAGDCTVEDGWVCSGSPSLCAPASCGNGSLEAGEACDDGNVAALDGCSPTCTVEPTCDATGCESPCGDGIVAGDEACDDGNVRSGDGCSETCVVEDGFTCSAASCERLGGRCALRVPVMFRDFNAHDATGGHPDFGPLVISAGATQGLVEAELDAEGKPVLSSAATASNGFMHGAAAFAEWYRTGATNAAIPGEIVLWEEGGYYVNRWGASGERWRAPVPLTEFSYGGPAGTGCAYCTPVAGQVCHDPCLAQGWNIYSCCGPAEVPSFDGNPLFFPIDGAPNALTEARGEGRVPPLYGFPGWPWETAAATELGVSTPIATATAAFPSLVHNFHFTTEVRFWFRFQLGLGYQLDFEGDDDLWVFLNGKLAVDLGGWHVPLSGLVSIDAAGVYIRTTLEEGGTPVEIQRPFADFGLVDGGLHSVAVFHAERQPEGSSFRFGLQGFDTQRSVCVR